MERAILMKEWLKTRMVFFICLLVSLAVAVYAIIMMNRLIELKGVDHLWLIMLLKDNSFVDTIKYIPMFAGIATGVAQMVPEMTQKRLKLTLHLPYSQNRLVALMLVTGLLELAVVFVVQASVISVYDSIILPSELVSRVILTTLPWYFAGFTAYLFVSAICLEGTNSRRIILSLLAIAVLMIYFLQPALEAYNGMIIVMVVFMAVLTILSYGSVARFKEGRQD